MAGMTFLQMQTAVMGTRFSEDQRGDVKSWINTRYWQAWSAERWTFRYATDLVTVTTGLQTVSGVAADFQRALSLERSNGDGLRYLEPRRFQARYYNATQTVTGIPEAYTILAGVLTVGPASSETKTDYLLTYEKTYTALVNDADVPALPEGCHDILLVSGATAIGLKRQNDFTWSFFEQDVDRALDTLRGDYLSDESDDDSSYPADPLGSYTGGLY